MTVYHPLDDKTILGPFGPTPSGSQWQAVKIISDGPGGPQIGGTPMPRVDINASGRIFAGWFDSSNKVWNMAYSDNGGLAWTVAANPAYFPQGEFTRHMLAHYDPTGASVLSFYGPGGPGATSIKIWRRTWSSTAGWSAPTRVYSGNGGITAVQMSVAHSRDHTQRAIVWMEWLGAPNNAGKFSFIDPSGAFTGPVEVPPPLTSYIPRGLVFDANNNPRVVFRVSGIPGYETGTGGRVTRVGGALPWGAMETFTIDGLTDPDAFLLLEGELSYDTISGLCNGDGSGLCHSGTYAGVDHYALKHVANPLTFRYRKRQGGDYVGVVTWSPPQDIDFTTLPMPSPAQIRECISNTG